MSHRSPTGSRCRPEACAKSWRSVRLPWAGTDRKRDTGSDSDSVPSSRSIMINTAVNVLLIDPIAKAVSGPGASSARKTSDAPTPSDHVNEPSRTTPAASPGVRHSRCFARTSRSSSSDNYGRPRAR